MKEDARPSCARKAGLAWSPLRHQHVGGQAVDPSHVKAAVGRDGASDPRLVHQRGAKQPLFQKELLVHVNNTGQVRILCRARRLRLHKTQLGVLEEAILVPPAGDPAYGEGKD